VRLVTLLFYSLRRRFRAQSDAVDRYAAQVCFSPGLTVLSTYRISATGASGVSWYNICWTVAARKNSPAVSPDAMVLRLMGLDHTRLTHNYSGRDCWLTDVAGVVEKKIIA
jgi:hypothetical protein